MFNLDQLAKKAQSLDMEIGVTMGLPVDKDVSSEDDATVRKGEAMLADAVRAVRDIGGNKLGGILYSAHTKYGRAPSERGWKNSVAAIAKTAELAKAAGIDLVLELVNRFETNLLNTTAQGLKFLKDTGSDHVRLHLDTFHMNIEEANPAAAIRLAGDKIGYFHVGESTRGYLGDGVIDFDRIFDALLDINYQRDIVFESFSTKVVDERSVYSLRNLARCLDRQSTARRARQAVHRTEIRRGRAPSRQQRQNLTWGIRRAPSSTWLGARRKSRKLLRRCADPAPPANCSFEGKPRRRGWTGAPTRVACASRPGRRSDCARLEPMAGARRTAASGSTVQRMGTRRSPPPFERSNMNRVS